MNSKLPVWAILVLFVGTAFGEGLGPEEVALKKKFEAACEKATNEADSRRDTLSEGFMRALAGVEKKFQQQAKLEALLEIRDLKRAVSEDGELPKVTNQEVSKLLKVYEQHVGTITNELNSKRNELIRIYVASLKKRLDASTREGDLDKAVAMKGEIDRVTLLLVEEKRPSSGEDVAVTGRKLPGSTKQLGEFVVNTIWNVESGGRFRFRGDGTMEMPWHDFQWKPTGKRSARMYTEAWQIYITFSEDMQSMRCDLSGGQNKFKATYDRRLVSAMSSQQVEKTLVSREWEFQESNETTMLKFGRSGKLEGDSEFVKWKTWELYDGVVILRGMRGEKKHRRELLMHSESLPLTFSSIEGPETEPRLIDASGR